MLYRAPRKKDKTKAQTKTAFDLEFDPPVINKLTSPEFQSSEFKSRCMEYFRVAVKAIAAGILSIASEYFPATYDVMATLSKLRTVNYMNPVRI